MPPPYAVVFTFRSEHDDTAFVFTAAVDSARARLRTQERGIPVILVDDCSPGAVWQAALADYEHTGQEMQVLRMGPPTAHSGITKGATEPSFGHAPPLDRGLWWAKHRLGCTRALVLDGDAIVLADDAVAQVDAALALLDGTTIMAGDWVGTPEDWTVRPQTSGVYWHETPRGRKPKSEHPLLIPAPIRAHGYDPLICSVVDLDAFWHPQAAPLLNYGWVANVWYYSQVARGKRSGYYPFFRGGMVAHLGHTAVSASRGWEHPFGNAPGVRYGGKGVGNYHAGWLQIADPQALLAYLRSRRPGDPVVPTFFVPPAAPEIADLVPHLRYVSPIASLNDEHATLGFEYVFDGQVCATATVTLDGDVCRIDAIDGPDVGSIYAELCEHVPALLRCIVWTPVALYRDARAERSAHIEERDGRTWAVWSRAFYIRSQPQHRWADYYDWDGLGTGLLPTAAPRIPA